MLVSIWSSNFNRLSWWTIRSGNISWLDHSALPPKVEIYNFDKTQPLAANAKTIAHGESIFPPLTLSPSHGDVKTREGIFLWHQSVSRIVVEANAHNRRCFLRVRRHRRRRGVTAIARYDGNWVAQCSFKLLTTLLDLLVDLATPHNNYSRVKWGNQWAAVWRHRVWRHSTVLSGAFTGNKYWCDHADLTLFNRLYSQELDEARLTNSRSLPGSPTVTKRRLSDVGDAESPETQLSLESMMKNFEKFAQHQWPTWAKRRGWVASDVVVHDDADRVVHLEKDKWIFQRKRKSHSSAATTPTVIHFNQNNSIRIDWFLKLIE